MVLLGKKFISFACDSPEVGGQSRRGRQFRSRRSMRSHEDPDPSYLVAPPLGKNFQTFSDYITPQGLRIFFTEHLSQKKYLIIPSIK